MSLVQAFLKDLTTKGKVSTTFDLAGLKFEITLLTTEQQLLADSLVDIDNIKKKYGATEHTYTFPDVIDKCRAISKLTFAIKSINGVSPVDLAATPDKQFQQRLELRDEITALNGVVIDELLQHYNVLVEREKDFFERLEENTKK